MQLPVITDRILQALPPVYLRDDTVESYDSAVIGQHFLHFKNTLRERNYSNLNMKNSKQNLVNEIIDLIFERKAKILIGFQFIQKIVSTKFHAFINFHRSYLDNSMSAK